MPKIIQRDGSIIDGTDLSYTSPNNYNEYLLRALNQNGWSATQTESGNGGYRQYHLEHPNEESRDIHVYLKPVVWRHRNEEEKAAQMSADLDTRGFDAINNGDAEKTYSFGIYRDPTASGNPSDQTDPYVICAWNPVEWGENHGVSSFNYFIRAQVISNAFKFGFSSMLAGNRKVFAFRPDFIHYYIFGRDSLHGVVENESTQTTQESIDTAEIPLNQILYGPPGTGKTYATISKAVEIINRVNTNGMSWPEIKRAYDNLVYDQKINFVTFHQSYSYEEFIEGIKPIVNAGNVQYEITDGIFKKLCKNATADANSNYVIIIDEINRGNISRIFGELITLIEDSKRLGKEEALTAKLTYSGQDENADPFGIPSNVFIIGTMNSADRSIALIDTALRRRFTFYNYPSNPTLISENVEGVNLRRMFEVINKRTEFLLDKDHLLGHGYFMHITTLVQLGKTFRNKIIPLLEEYFYGDFEKIQFVLGDNPEYGKPIELRMIAISPSNAQRDLFGTDIDGFEDKSIYSLLSELQHEEYDNVSADVYKSIYGEFPELQSRLKESDSDESQDN